MGRQRHSRGETCGSLDPVSRRIPPGDMGGCVLVEENPVVKVLTLPLWKQGGKCEEQDHLACLM